MYFFFFFSSCYWHDFSDKVFTKKSILAVIFNLKREMENDSTINKASNTTMKNIGFLTLTHVFFMLISHNLQRTFLKKGVEFINRKINTSFLKYQEIKKLYTFLGLNTYLNDPNLALFIRAFPIFTKT